MNKIICEMCGTVYPDTAHQCPICGCAQPSDPQMQANQPQAEEAAAGYTYVKGGRFSKSNVRKRNNMAKAAAVYEQDDMDEDEIPKESNRGLTIAIIVLLLAIIAVAAYIYIRFFAGSGSGKEKPVVTTPVVTTTPVITTTQPTTPPATTPEPTTTVETTPDKSCTGVTLTDQSVTFSNLGGVWTLTATVEPADTVDQLTFTSSDPTVATVDANGRIIAIGNGTATITVSCGTASAQCAITVQVPEENKDLRFNAYEPFEGSLTKGSYFSLKLYDKNDKNRTALEVTNWTSSKPGVATVTEEGGVKAVSTGTTEISCTYEGWVYTCKIIVTEEKKNN